MAYRLQRLLVSTFILWVLFTLPTRSFADELVALEDKISRLAETENIGAIAYGIVSKDRVLTAKALGTYSQADDRKISLDSIFRIGSISKTFTALGALLLEHDEVLNLSAPIKSYIRKPPFTNLWSEQYPITGAQLLEHTAGLRDMSQLEFDQPLPLTLELAFKVDPHSRITAWRPGMHSSYSNSGAGIMTAVVETVSGKPFSRFMEDRVFSSLALHSASFNPPQDINRVLVKGYDTNGTTPIPYWHQLYPAFGSLNISSNDMLRFVQILLNNGVVSGEQKLPVEVIQKMSKPTSSLAARAGLTYGYGKGLYHFQHNGETFFGHGGDADGYLAFMAFSPRLDRGYFVVINAYKQQVLKRIRVILQNSITKNSRQVYPPQTSLSEANIDMLLGNYEEITTRFASQAPPRKMVVTRAKSGEYFTRIDSQSPKQLLPVEKRLFRRNWQSVATIALIPFAKEIYLQGDFGNFIKAMAHKKPSDVP